MNSLKKGLSVFLALSMVLSFCACEKTVSVSPEASTSVSASTEASVSTETSVPDPTPEPAKEYVETPIVVSEDEGHTVYVVKGDEQVGSYRVKINNFGEASFAYGDYIFYRQYQPDQAFEGDSNAYAYKAYNYKTGEDTLLTMGEWNGCIDIYKGKVVVTVYSAPAGMYVERCFDEKTLAPIDGNNKFLEEIPKAYNNLIMLDTIDYLKGYCVDRFLDEVGFVRLRKDGKIYNYDGEAVNEFDEICDEDKDRYDLLYFDDECVVYQTHNDDYSVKKFVDQSLITGRRTVISSDFAYLVAIEDGVLYFLENEDSEYGLYVKTLCKYNVKEHMKEKLATRQSYPGTHGSAPFGSIQVSGGTVYAVTNDGQKRDWSVLINGDFKQLGIEPWYFDFGTDVTVDYLSQTTKCNICNETIGGYYGEYGILGSSYGDKVDVINKVLKDSVVNQCETFLGTEPYFSTDAEECKNCGHGSEWGMLTYERTLDRVFKISDNYLTVENSAYWYGGGAHGYPFIFTYLFDLRTGEQVPFTDIYTGTEEDLKKVVAEATKGHAQCFTEDLSPYYSSDPDEVYEQAYEYISLETIQVTYQKGGLTVIYPPYDMGPYASGFIEVFIPYSDLGIYAFNEG
ncbi:MAG: DUF3298 domain-containing protein [Lachnospiraceae bacterium]|nr:DUF3298 domain-containing protein [Lachnospiraceae bacterium]